MEAFPKDRIIVRQNALSHATALFISGKLPGQPAVMEIAEKLEAWVWRGIEDQAPAPRPAVPIQNKGGIQHLCSHCNAEVSTKVKEFSEQKYKKILCFNCQNPK